MVKKNLNKPQLSDTIDWKISTDKIIKERKEFAQYIKNRPSKKEPDILKNKTDKWIAFLKSDKRLKKNSFTTLNIANRGGGKTAQTFKETNILLENLKRNVQFWGAPNSLIESIELVCPDNRKERYETINKLKDIKFNSIFCIDEGLLGINAKEALKKEMKDIIKFVSKSRHYNIICIINSVSLGILKQFRDAIDIISYRRLSEMFIRNNANKDYTLIDYRDTLLNLEDWESILFSSYKRFTTKGFISMKFEDHCPWFFDDISTYQSSTSPDVAFDENERLQGLHISLAQNLVRLVGKQFVGKNGLRKFRNWLYINDLDMFYDNFRYLKTIYELYLYYLENAPHLLIERDKKQLELGYKEESEKEWQKSTFGHSKEDIENFVEREVNWRDKKREFAINTEIQKGVLQTILADKYKTTHNNISMIGSKVQGAITKFRGDLFEIEYERYLKNVRNPNGTKKYADVKRLGNKEEPDIIAHDLNENDLYVFSLKTKSQKPPYNFSKEDSKVEYEYAYTNSFGNNYNKVHLYLVVQNDADNTIKKIKLNYLNPTSVRV